MKSSEIIVLANTVRDTIDFSHRILLDKVHNVLNRYFYISFRNINHMKLVRWKQTEIATQWELLGRALT